MKHCFLSQKLIFISSMHHFYNIQKCLIWMILQMNTMKLTIKNGHIFQIIHTECK